MTKDEALKLALEALSPDPYRSEWAVALDMDKAITAIKEALAEQDSKDKEQAKTDSFVRQLDEALAQQEPNYKKAFEVWLEKTEWVQKTVKPHELGMHRADVLKQRIKEVLAQPKQDSYYGYKGKCNRVMSDGNPCGLNAPCPDCGLSLIDCPQPEPWEKFCDSNCVWTDHHPDCKLAQPEQEPVAWMRQDGQRVTTASDRHNYPDYETRYSIPLYTTPPQRKPLTDEDLRKLADKHLFYQPEGYEVSGVFALARAIEAAHGIKGEA